MALDDAKALDDTKALDATAEVNPGTLVTLRTRDKTLTVTYATIQKNSAARRAVSSMASQGRTDVYRFTLTCSRERHQ